MNTECAVKWDGCEGQARWTAACCGKPLCRNAACEAVHETEPCSRGDWTQFSSGRVLRTSGMGWGTATRMLEEDWVEPLLEKLLGWAVDERGHSVRKGSLRFSAVGAVGGRYVSVVCGGCAENGGKGCGSIFTMLESGKVVVA